MKIGAHIMFQNLERGSSADMAVVAEDIGLADLAVACGFDSLWTTEHHFAGYSMIPNQLIVLGHLAGRHPGVEVGTAVVVMPWHNPLRVAGEVALLDNVVGGRLLLGLGRGLGRIEFEGFGIPMEESRERFVEGAEQLLDALDSGTADYSGSYYSSPRREVRPSPTGPFRSRSYAAAVSPPSAEIMAKLGIGLMISPQKPWDEVRKDIAVHRERFVELHGHTPPAPIYQPKVFCDVDAGRVREVGYEYMRRYYLAVRKHYELDNDHFAKTKGYEFYAKPWFDEALAEKQTVEPGHDEFDGFVDVQVIGTPEECIEQIREVNDVVGMDSLVGLFGFGDMPFDDAARNVRTFAEKVMPVVRSFERPVEADFEEPQIVRG